MIIQVQAQSIVELWLNAITQLHQHGSSIDDLWKDAPALLTLHNKFPEQYYSDLFPMTQNNVDDINSYLVTGEHEDRVIHDWTKLYRHRLFDGHNQIAHIIEYLKKKPHGMRAQASVWNQAEDLYGKIGPCFQLAWFRVNADNKLDIHVHMRACDAYGKLLMNVNEFVALQQYIASAIGVEPGTYLHFIDSCHFNLSDKEKVQALLHKIS